MSIFRLIELHPDREKIVSDLSAPINIGGVVTTGHDPNSRTGQIKIESSRRLEQLLDKLFSKFTQAEAADMSVFTEFGEAYSRLLKTGQMPKAHDVLGELLERLSSPEAFVRQKSLDLLTLITADLNLLTDLSVLEITVQSLHTSLAARKESYEYSELIWCVARKCLAGKRYDFLARLISALAQRRRLQDGVTIYDSMAIKKAFENVGRPEVVSALVEDLLKARIEDVGHIKTIMIGIGSEEIALALSHIISHPIRQVRQLSLKILAELGKNSLKVFSDLLVDDVWFERDKDRHELPDAKWYVVRNTIFVLGSLRDRGGVAALRLRINDPDIRVRREIISSLEKIGGDDAIDLLILMAEDRDREIREAALGGLGMIGTPVYLPLLIDLTRRNPADSIRAVAAMGKIGGTDARLFLGGLLDDEEALTQFSAGKVSREDLRAAIVRALGSIGDAESISKIKAFQNSLSTAQKLLMRGSTVQKAIAEVLSRH
jgi:HEAT repeat protein